MFASVERDLEVQLLLAGGLSNRSILVRRSLASWCPPQSGRVKLNCDGSVSNNREHVGIGAVVRNADGGFLGAVGQRLNLRLDPYVCELFAIKNGLEFVLEQGWRHVVVETDSLEAVNVVNGVGDCFADAGVVVERIRCMLIAE